MSLQIFEIHADFCFSVDKEVRKCGIGRALMAKIHKIAEKEKAAIIATNPESHHAAHALYRKLGEFQDRPH